MALATERPAIDVRPLEGIAIRVHPRRGLDIGAAWFRGSPLAWIGPAGEGGGDAAGWREAWGGGLLTTCGLDNVGAASEGIGLHGTYTFLEARDVETERSVSEVVVRGAVDDPRGLRVERTIRSAVGSPRVELVDRTTNLAGEALGLRLAVQSDLPRLWQWVDPAPGVYALAIEPANCSVLGRAHDRAGGTLPFLPPGEERTTRIAIIVEELG